MSLCVNVSRVHVMDSEGPRPPCNTPWRPRLLREASRPSRTTVFQTRSHITKGFHLKQGTLSSHSLKKNGPMLPKLSITRLSKVGAKAFSGISRSNPHFSSALDFPYNGIARGKSLITTSHEYESNRLLENTPEPFPVSPECGYKATSNSRSSISERRGYEYRPTLSTGSIVFRGDEDESQQLPTINPSIKVRDDREFKTTESRKCTKPGKDNTKHQAIPRNLASPLANKAKYEALSNDQSQISHWNNSPSPITGPQNDDSQASQASNRQNIASQTTQSSEDEAVSNKPPLRESVRTQTEATRLLLDLARVGHESRASPCAVRVIPSSEALLYGGDDFGWKAIPTGASTPSGRQEYEYKAMPRSRSFMSSRRERVFTEMSELAAIPGKQELDVSASYLANFPLDYRWRNRRRKLVPKMAQPPVDLSVVGNKPASILNLPTLSQTRLNVTPQDWAPARPGTPLDSQLITPSVSPGLQVKGRKMAQRSQYNLMNMTRDYKLGHVVNRVVHCDRMESHWIANDRHLFNYRCDDNESYHRGFLRYVETTNARDVDDWSVNAELSSASPFVEHATDENLEEFFRPRTRPDLWRRDVSVNRADTRNSASSSEKCSTEPSQYSSVTNTMSGTEVGEAHEYVGVVGSGGLSLPPIGVTERSDHLPSSTTSPKTQSGTEIEECETSANKVPSEGTITDAGATGSPSVLDHSSPVMSASSQTQSTHDTSSTAVPVFSDSEEEKGSVKSESQTVVYRSSQNTSDALTFYSSSQAYPYSRETSSTCTCSLRNVTSQVERQTTCSSTSGEGQSVQTMTETVSKELIYKDATTSTSPLEEFKQSKKVMRGKKLSRKWAKRMNADSEVYWTEMESRHKDTQASSKRKGVLYETTPTPFRRQSYMFFTPVSDTRYDKWMRNNGRAKKTQSFERRKSKSMTPSGGRFMTRKPSEDNSQEDGEYHYFRYTKKGTPNEESGKRQRQTATGEDIFYLTSPSTTLEVDQKTETAKDDSSSGHSIRKSNPPLEDWLISGGTKNLGHNPSALPPLVRILTEDFNISKKSPVTMSDEAIRLDGIKLAPSDHIKTGRPQNIAKEASGDEANLSASEPPRMNTKQIFSPEDGSDLASSHESVIADKGSPRYWNSSSISGSLYSSRSRAKAKRKSKTVLDSCRSENSTPRRGSVTNGAGHCSLITGASFKVSSLLSKSTATYAHKSVVSKHGGAHKACRKKKSRTPRMLSQPGPLTQRSKIFTLQEILRFLPNIGLIDVPNTKTSRREAAARRKEAVKSPMKNSGRPVGDKPETDSLRPTRTSPAFTYSVFDLPAAYKKQNKETKS